MLSNASQVFKEFPAHLVNIQVPHTLRHAALLNGVSIPWLARSHPLGSHAALKSRGSPITNIQQYHGNTQLDAGGTP